MFYKSGGNHSVIGEIGASPTGDGDAVFDVTLYRSNVTERNVDIVRLYDADRNLVSSVPIPENHSRDDTGTRETYSVHLGEKPLHGRYTAVATTVDGENIDERTVDFHCWASDA
ncbi:hypothetical protein [Natrinema longum]|uniref:Uncharacterized protein n=1 Tax=Natrinema longum TaxID=370324 RepID=A0A8A2U4P3_9EURY|nr:hypothetical protein [Natrinema longum]MBZ6494791.1 hypothetical protein [Natrinema longum]QSW83901.1 hypothetical protein J0X27_10510 [Natrinema longum]